MASGGNANTPPFDQNDGILLCGRTKSKADLRNEFRAGVNRGGKSTLGSDLSVKEYV